MSQIRVCWCGNANLVRFNDAYRRCERCETLVTACEPAQADPHVLNDEADFYGRNYWFKHQVQDLGFANIETRARTDLTERCQHWMRSILRYKMPPARTLELGCAHGGFVKMLDAAGFAATGLELSPAIVEFARRTFGVPILQGPIEQQDVEKGSLDVILMMDVMEHLPDPVGTLGRCAQLLKPDGLLIAQTPRYPEGETYENMVASNDPFLEQLKSDEHLYLFSERSARQLLSQVGLRHATLEPAMFARYDMFLFASASELASRGEGELETVLLSSGQGRMALSWLDMARDMGKLRETITEIDLDRARRLEQIQTLTAEVKQLHSRIEVIETDRADRLTQIQKMDAIIRQSSREPDAEAAIQAEALAKAVAAARAQAEVEATSRYEAKAAVEAKVRAETQARAKLEADAQTRAAAQAKAEFDAQTRAAAQAKAEADAQTRAAAQAKAEADAQTRAAAQAKAEFDAQTRAAAQAKAECDARARETAGLRETIVEIDADRARRLEQIQILTGEVKQLHSRIEVIETDRADRLTQIHTLDAIVKRLEREAQARADADAQILAQAVAEAEAAAGSRGRAEQALELEPGGDQVVLSMTRAAQEDAE